MDKGYPEFGYHLNRTGRPMIYACSWPVYQTYSGMTVRKRGRFADVATHTEKFNSLLPVAFIYVRKSVMWQCRCITSYTRSLVYKTQLVIFMNLSI